MHELSSTKAIYITANKQKEQLETPMDTRSPFPFGMQQQYSHISLDSVAKK